MVLQTLVLISSIVGCILKWFCYILSQLCIQIRFCNIHCKKDLMYLQIITLKIRCATRKHSFILMFNSIAKITNKYIYSCLQYVFLCLSGWKRKKAVNTNGVISVMQYSKLWYFFDNGDWKGNMHSLQPPENHGDFNCHKLECIFNSQNNTKWIGIAQH